MDLSQDKMVARYYELCDVRDATYAKAASLEAELDALNAQISDLQGKAQAKASEIETVWGPDHLKLKKEIAQIARFLVRIPPRP